MHSEVRSSVSLITANKPLTKVQRHSAVKRILTHDSGKNADFSTNDFLRNGGILPPVLPCTEGINSNSTSKQNSNKKPVMGQSDTNRPPILRKTASFALHNKELNGRICNESISISDFEAHQHSSCQLEQKVDHLCKKISKVQDIILNRITGDTNVAKSTTKNVGNFSSSDYKFFVLEMNRNVTTKPYDPNDFSVKEKS